MSTDQSEAAALENEKARVRNEFKTLSLLADINEIDGMRNVQRGMNGIKLSVMGATGNIKVTANSTKRMGRIDMGRYRGPKAMQSREHCTQCFAFIGPGKPRKCENCLHPKPKEEPINEPAPSSPLVVEETQMQAEGAITVAEVPPSVQ